MSLKRVYHATWILGAICLLDLLSTLLLFQTGLALEANPVLRPVAEAGLLPFTAVKLISFIPALLILEYLRQTHREKQTVEKLLRLAVVGYVVIYSTSSLIQFI